MPDSDSESDSDSEFAAGARQLKIRNDVEDLATRLVLAFELMRSA